MVSALVHGASGPGSSPGRGDCVVFLGETLNSHSVSLTNCGEMTCDGLASCPGGVAPSRFMLQRPGISSGSYGPLRIERLHFCRRLEVLNRSIIVIDSAVSLETLLYSHAGVTNFSVSTHLDSRSTSPVFRILINKKG